MYAFIENVHNNMHQGDVTLNSFEHKSTYSYFGRVQPPLACCALPGVSNSQCIVVRYDTLMGVGDDTPVECSRLCAQPLRCDQIKFQ